MRLALATLCVGATVFLVRFLIALIFDGVNSAGRTEEFYFARFAPARRRGELIAIMRGEQAQGLRAGTHSRRAG